MRLVILVIVSLAPVAISSLTHDLWAAQPSPRGAPTNSQGPTQVDPFLKVSSVELPSGGSDPQRIAIIVTLASTGCRTLVHPVVDRRMEFITVLPRSVAVKGGRCPSGENASMTQLIELGSLPRGTYRLRVATGKAVVRKILNVY